jgi:O-antigen/teichoic acid export membrane protein
MVRQPGSSRRTGSRRLLSESEVREVPDGQVHIISAHTEGETIPQAPSALAADVAHSVRNAAILGLSLLATWAVALVVRIFLPRHLGPVGFGAYQFADSFTVTVFVVLNLGIETYVRKEITTRTEHASEFFGGVLIVRIVAGIVMMAAAVWGLGYAGKSRSVLELTLVLGAAQVLVIINLTYAALLQAVGRVGGLSLLLVVSKVIWAVGIFGAFALGGGMGSAACAMLVSEMVRTIGLVILADRHLDVQYTLNAAATRAVIRESVPYYIGVLAVTVYSRIDVSIMSFLTTDVEVGWYGAASNVASMGMLLSPLIGWVLLPLTSRAASRSQEELTLVGTRAMELILCAAIPVSLFLYLASEEIVIRLFGQAYAPSISSMQIQAPVFVLTYVAIVSATLLVRLERAWALTWITVIGMLVSPALNLILIPEGLRIFGRGGAGIGAAITLVITEFATTIAMTWLLRGQVFDRRSVTMITKTLIVSVLVIVLDLLIARLGLWRLAIEAMTYLTVVIWWGALDVRGMSAIVRQMRARRTTPVALAEAT